jgi:adenylate cyclase
VSTITVRGTTDQRVEASAAVSILNNLLRSGVKISHLCGGRAICGTCRIRIIAGMEYLSPMRQDEEQRLAADGVNGPDIRLACQCYTRGDVVIKVLAPGK